MKKTFIAGARGSRLSLAQTEGAVRKLAEIFPGTKYRIMPVETPGDRDLSTPIEQAADDFFTRDLDDAVLEGRIDFAVHSAKDLPAQLREGLDWFWLDGGEDPRDCWVARAGEMARCGGKFKFAAPARRAPKIGVSGERRAAYAASVFPKAKLLTIRGAIDSRIAQLKAGKYDAVLMAMAGLKRLYGAAPQGVEWLPVETDELAPPEAQGRLAIVFRAGDENLRRMRLEFVKAVRFVSAGVGDARLCTLAGADDIAAADVVLCDDLLGPELRAFAAPGAKWVRVGKRCGAHSMDQRGITRLICDEARKGRRVVRLKGGDAGLFGRLAEETDALADLAIPFLVRPGVSALVAATTGTGMLLTRRGESCGFTAFTPRSGGAETPLAMFMATKVIPAEAKRLIAEGWPADTPCAVVWDAAGPGERVWRGTLTSAMAGVKAGPGNPPGLWIVGKAAERGWPKAGALAGEKVLVTCSEAVQDRACRAVEDAGGRPLRRPLIRLMPRPLRFNPQEWDAVALTSPSAVRIFFAGFAGDLRRLPKFITCGAGTDAELRRHGAASDVMPAEDFSAEGLVNEIARRDLRGWRVLRLRSAKAGGAVARALRKAGARVEDAVLYDNAPVRHEASLPDFGKVFFASASAVESFLAQYGEKALRGKGVLVMGKPTLAALPEKFRRRAQFFQRRIMMDTAAPSPKPSPLCFGD